MEISSIWNCQDGLANRDLVSSTCEVVYAISPMCVGTLRESAVRHPSSLYKRFSKARCCLPLLWLVSRKPRQQVCRRRYFFAVMAVFRLLTELFREPVRTSALSYLVVSVWASCCRCRWLIRPDSAGPSCCKMRARRQLETGFRTPNYSQQSKSAKLCRVLDLMRHVRDHGTLKMIAPVPAPTVYLAIKCVCPGRRLSSGHHQENVLKGHYS